MKSPYSSSINCRVCHQPILTPPIGKTAGLCGPPRPCWAAGALTSAQLRDFVAAANDILGGRVTAEVEPETQVTWLAQVPLKPAPPQAVAYDDDGTPRYFDLSSPTGQTWRKGVDICEGGSDPRLDKYRDHEDDDGAQ